MPELPEVETTARYLRERILGCTVQAVTVNWQRSIHTPGPGAFTAELCGASVTNVDRRGKYVVITLARGSKPARFLLGHLRMSGSLDVVSPDAARSKHDRVVLAFSENKELRFNDPRKFGRLYLVDDPAKITGKLGPEPLAEEFTAARFYGALHEKRGAIKPLLLNQTFIAGIGNIYADESLWKAGIHPKRTALRVSHEKACLLHRAIRQILQKAIDNQGTDFGDGVIDEGLYEPRVYGREGKPCRRCRQPIRKIFLGQRGTHFCPRCQK